MEELDKGMYFGAKPGIIEKAKILRNNMTSFEEILWDRLKGKQVSGLRFRRQHPIDIFIADFYCHAARLVVEIDGEIHCMSNEYDEGRTAEMEKYDIKVIRFSNEEVQNELDAVVGKINFIALERTKSPPWGI